MSKPRKHKHLAEQGALKEDHSLSSVHGSPPAQVSGIFQDDPTFEEFRKILREQREADYRRASAEAEAMTRQAEARTCSSSTPTRSL